jgi:hypothetical protein
MAGEKRKLLEQARALGMGLAALRYLPVSEVRKRIEAREAEVRRRAGSPRGRK